MSAPDDLVSQALAASKRAYAPYSKFHVGCAVESVDGTIVTGANMENACYRLGLCAEQSALTAAQHAFGLENVVRIAVAGGSIEPKDGDKIAAITPCGGCRQAIAEAAKLGNRDIEIHCADREGGQQIVVKISELLPLAFDIDAK